MTARHQLPPHQPRPEGAKLALSGVRIIDFSHFIAGPTASMILADFGAEVIKIENAARGDDMRQGAGPRIGGEGGAFLWANRNKQSIGLDLSVPEGREVARQLIAKADIVVENFSSGVMERLGLDYPSVLQDNPRLIYCLISAFGRNGELARRAGFDPIGQAEGGLMAINGHPDAPRDDRHAHRGFDLRHDGEQCDPRSFGRPQSARHRPARRNCHVRPGSDDAGLSCHQYADLR